MDLNLIYNWYICLFWLNNFIIFCIFLFCYVSMNFNKMLLEMVGIKFSGFKYVIEI